jgi:hypothetical protein
MAQTDVYVKLPSGKTTVYYVHLHDTIEKICQKIAEEEKIKLTQVRLKYQGKTLQSSHSMSYLGVRPETILKAEVTTMNMSQPTNIIILNVYMQDFCEKIIIIKCYSIKVGKH